MFSTDLPKSLRERPWRGFAFVLGEPFLGFLAIVALGLTLLPMLFGVSEAVQNGLEAGQWTIVALFAIEYLVALAVAPSRSAFLRNPWRLIDAVTILLPLVTLLPGVTAALRSSPLLRLVRLARVVTLGLRASGIVVRGSTVAALAAQEEPVEISRVAPGREQTFAPGTWEDLERWLQTPGGVWCHVSGADADDAARLAAMAGVSTQTIESHYLNASYSHQDSDDQHAEIYVWLPEKGGARAASRNGLLLLVGKENLLTLSRRPTRLVEDVAKRPIPRALAGLPFSLRTSCLLLQEVLNRNEQLVGRLEEEVRLLEEIPIRESRPEFFERTFRLKKEMSAVQPDLWRLKGMLNELADGRALLPGGGGAEKVLLRDLVADGEYLYETITNLREELLSLIELHLNVVSFDMNRVMRVLAVVSVLGLIPAVIGGLFGMNLADNPWPFTLPQIGFVVVFGMVLCLYLFFIKGWLR